LFVCLCVVVSAMKFVAVAAILLLASVAFADEEPTSGKCGEIDWALNEAKTELTLSGTGDMGDLCNISGASTVTTIVVGEGITKIGDEAFDGFEAVTSVTLPESLLKIGEAAFYECKSLKSIKIPEAVTKIQKYAFMKCESLESFTIPAAVVEVGKSAFAYCQKLANFTVAEGNENYIAALGILFTHDASELVAYPGGRVGYVELNGTNVSAITEGAFAGAENLMYVLLNEHITTIEESTFEDCKGLIVVQLGENIDKIKAKAFKNCQSLKGIIIPNATTVIGEEAFKGCKLVQAAVVGKGVKDIRNEAFSGCSKMSIFAFQGTTDPGQLSSDVFKDCDSLAGICVYPSYVDTKFCGEDVATSGEFCGQQYSSGVGPKPEPPAPGHSSGSSASFVMPSALVALVATAVLLL